MSVRHRFLLSVICLLYSATCCPDVFELNKQFAKGNVSRLAVTKIDLNGYKRDFSRPRLERFCDGVLYLHTRAEGRPKSTSQQRALGINTCSQWALIQQCVEFLGDGA